MFVAYCVPQLHDLLAPTALSLPTERSAIISATLPVALYIVCRIKALFLLHSKLCLWCRALHPVVADAAFRIVQPRTLHGVQCIAPTLRSQIGQTVSGRSGTLQPSAALCSPLRQCRRSVPFGREWSHRCTLRCADPTAMATTTRTCASAQRSAGRSHSGTRSGSSSCPRSAA